MNVSLTPQLEKIVRQKVKTGKYQTASEVIREALRLMEERDRDRESRLEALRREIAIGIDELDRGKAAPLDIEKVKASGRKKLGRRAHRPR